MIVGTVNLYREAIVRLRVSGPQGQAQDVDIVIDTGFDGALSLPPAIITTLGLPYKRSGRALLADGSESVFNIYEATVDWDGRPRRIAVDEADTEPLLGMGLLEGYELRVQARVGGGVFITALP